MSFNVRKPSISRSIPGGPKLPSLAQLQLAGLAEPAGCWAGMAAVSEVAELAVLAGRGEEAELCGGFADRLGWAG